MKVQKKSKQSGNNTIQKKLLKNSIGIIAISLLALGIVSSYLNYQTTVTSLEQTMVETVIQSATSITNKMEGYKRLAEEMKYNPILRSTTATKEAKLAECDSLAERNSLNMVAITDADGLTLKSGQSMEEFSFFSEPKKTNETFVSNLIVDEETKTMNIYISSPILENNKFDGILYFGIDASVLCEIAESIHIGETGNASIISGKGDTIGYSDKQLVLDAYNTQNEVKNDPKLEQLAAIERRVMAGETDFGSYTYDGVNKYAAFTPINGTPGWGMYVAVKKSEFLKGTYTSVLLIIILLAASLAIGILLMIKSAASIVRPIKSCVSRIQLLAEGDIHSEVPKIATGDETQILADSMAILVKNMNKVVSDIDYCLKELASGNFTAKSEAAESYTGDFTNIIGSIIQLKDTLSGAILQIKESSQQVSLGAEQLSSNAQSLAEGSSNQANALEDLNSTIITITELSQTNASTAEKATITVEQATKEAEQSSKDMDALRTAMERISSTSKNIETIIAEIEDIASQTNLLSLNASIEAARAGEAGKGFAVVAEQIGTLASSSAQSAVNTKELIGKSLDEIAKGNEITMKATASFESIIFKMHDFEQLANEVNGISRNQAESLKEIEHGMERISSVVQSNSASAQESSATSEELSAQSTTLNELIGKFRCNKIK